jgi:hypothetical protein
MLRALNISISPEHFGILFPLIENCRIIVLVFYLDTSAAGAIGDGLQSKKWPI